MHKESLKWFPEQMSGNVEKLFESQDSDYFYEKPTKYNYSYYYSHS